MSARPLEGLRVLEFSHTIMGPCAGLILADLGAEVVKVEPTPSGDHTRRLPGFAAGFFATRTEMIASRRVSEEVIRELNLSEWKELHGVEDPTAELMGWIRVKPRKNSNLVDVSLEGGDPQVNAARLKALLDGGGSVAEQEAVALNAGALLWIAGLAADLREGTGRALDALRSGGAGRTLGAFVEASRG